MGGMLRSVAFLLQTALCAAAGLRFAFFNGKLYGTIQSQNEHFGDTMMIGLLQLEHYHNREGWALPDVYGDIDGGLTCDGEGGDFSHWRTPGTNSSILFPDSDYWGYPKSHIPPMPFIMAAFEREMPAWQERAPLAFWTGNGGEQPLAHTWFAPRRDYIACAKSNPSHMVASEVKWGANTGFVHSRTVRMKDLASDLRKLLRYTHIVYLRGNTWSSAYKRDLVSGGAVFADRHSPHESFFTQIMDGCKDCLLYYDVDNLCSSILDAAADANIHVQQKAKRLREHVYDHFSPPKMRAGMVGALREQAARTDYSFRTEGDTVIVSGGKEEIRLKRVSCAEHLTQFIESCEHGDGWQVATWYDRTTCDFAVDGGDYLKYSAV